MKEYEVEYVIKAIKNIVVDEDEDFEDAILEDFQDEVVGFKILSTELTHDYEEEAEEASYLNTEYERSLL